MAKYISNGWNTVHLLGGTLTNWFLFFFIKMERDRSAVLAMLPTAFKELGDLIACLTGSKWMAKIGFDPAGPDIRDIVMALIGTVGGYLAIIIKEAL